MKRKWLTILLTLLAGFTLVLGGCARTEQKNSWPRIKQDKKVVVGLDDSFVPMGFRQKNGTVAGYDIDLARALFKLYGVKVSFQTIDWSMKETELRNQTIDLIWNGYTVTPERQKQVAFSQEYLKNHQVLVTKRADHINSFADMKGKVVGAQSESSGASDIDAQPKKLKDLIKNREPVLYDTFDNAFLDLNAGRIQGIVIDEVYANYYIAHQKDPSAYKVIQGTYPAEDFAVGMRKSDNELRDKINTGLKTLKANGTLKKLNEKWFGVASVD
ncbi:amino acid ABC transporter substrate-binding protein [Lacticaseibacillus camelliae]|uniref:Amino acid ABC transporter substrate-binding protein n=1 Tax=Lacticaseibacillus camelliae DSM 22697 = JCM 13995 TaxID=1423730 RepID=A0A0R2FB31_9LACO|nr:amino acid ABC transporter substrate-binding protein [Lacticaseibacillus camelliae]KRN25593.1 amino acid ABC transporter substrate-binding protein [Lacticaseibacillus camelliae DSM 22697 = JCM 13995]